MLYSLLFLFPVAVFLYIILSGLIALKSLPKTEQKILWKKNFGFVKKYPTSVFSGQYGSGSKIIIYEEFLCLSGNILSAAGLKRGGLLKMISLRDILSVSIQETNDLFGKIQGVVVEFMVDDKKESIFLKLDRRDSFILIIEAAIHKIR